MDHQELWRAALGEIELAISKANFNTWFKNTSLLSNENGQVVIGVPSGFAKEWLENKYNHYILQALQRLDKGIKGINCIIYAPERPRIDPPAPAAGRSIDAVRPKESHGSQTSHPTPPSEINGSDTRKTAPPAKPSPASIRLNPRYTFESFIVGENNDLARAACYAVAEHPGNTYNPLFIYGGVGLGKTHLIQAIGNHVAEHQPDLRIHYTTSQDFTDKIIEALQNKSIKEFLSHYQHTDILLIDDIQFLSGREKTQEIFFNIFNSLYQLNKQIVMTSDRPPQAIPTIEDRLRSRFASGMIADINRPGLETRLAILRLKMNEKSVRVDDDSLHFIAESMVNNIRELEGALNRVVAACELQGLTPNLLLTQKILSPLVTQTKKALNKERVVATVAEFFHLPAEELMKKTRKKEIVEPRQIAMFFMRQELSLPLSAIGKFFGGKDHTTTLHACEKIERRINENEAFREEINQIKERLYQEQLS